MKVKLHIPTEQYGFVECELESSAETIQEAIEMYPKSVAGLAEKDFDQFIQTILEGGSNHTDQLDKLSPEQYKTMKVVHRAMNRIEYKSRKLEEETKPIIH